MYPKTFEQLDFSNVSRRRFMQGAAGLTLVVGTSGLIAACGNEHEGELMSDFAPNVWATIASDGSITVQVPACEMGQGPMTSLPLIFAEEADADWDDIRPVQVTVPRKEYGNPFFGGIVYTGGSRAVDDYYLPLRKAGAQARYLLMAAAADHWGVPIEEVTTEPSVVVHEPSGNRLTYGEVAAFATVPDRLPEITETDLKDPADFRLIGYNMPRIDVPLKVNGTCQYAMDVNLPGMVYAAVAHAPVEGENPVSVDDSDALALDGVEQVVKLDNGVAVLGTTVEATRFGKDALKIEWSRNSPLRGVNNEDTLARYSEAANDLGQKGNLWQKEGDFESAFENAGETVSREYFADYVYHAQMEPLNATAWVKEDGKSAEIWTGTQSQTLTLLTASEVLGIPQDQITLHQMYLGGGFGRRAELKPTYLIEALQLSKRLKKPVKVIWSREDDLQNGWFRPTTAQLMRAAFDEDGNVLAWSHRMAGPSVLEFYNTIRWSMADGRDIISMLGSEIENYHVPHKLVQHVMVDRAARLSPWRGVATGYTKFAVESFVDELAHERGEDPIEFRLNRLHLTDRARNVLETAAEAADWGSARPEGRALGVSLSEYHATPAAGIFEISLNEKTGKIRVHNVWVAADPGVVVQPLNVETQLEGALIYGIGQTLTERVTIADGQVQQSNFHDYQVMRIDEVPDIHTRVISSDNHPSGVGELALPLTGGGIANALYALTGKRLRHMPLTPDRVLQALKA